MVAAKAFGFFFFKRTNTTITVRERTPRGTTDVEYEVLNILEFNSTRKRMSVVVKEKANEKIIIFCKVGGGVTVETRWEADEQDGAGAAVVAAQSAAANGQESHNGHDVVVYDFPRVVSSCNIANMICLNSDAGCGHGHLRAPGPQLRA